jgi:hypothetical protein
MQTDHIQPQAPGPTNMQNRVLFVVGNSRSGTTMLGRIFGRHSRVHTFGELHFFEQWVSARGVRERTAWPTERLRALLDRLLTSSREGIFQQVTRGRFDADRERILAAAGTDDPVSLYAAFLQDETGRQGKSVPCEQTPRYLFFAGEILDAFPGARIINMVRDPRDVLLSQKNKWRRRYLGARNIPLREAARSWVNYHAYTVSRLWVAAARTARRFEGHPRFTTLRFEDLVAHPEESIRPLCAFAGISYEPAMLDVPQVGSSTGRDRPDRRGIDAGRSGTWQRGGLSDLELEICERVTRGERERFGYTGEGRRVSAFLWAASMSVFAVKAALALMLNLGRTRNLRETLKRRLQGGAAK